MAKLIGNKPMFSCGELFCAEWLPTSESVIENKLQISAKIKSVYLIRGLLELADGATEQDCIDRLASNGIQSMWVDSESDARAQSMEGAA